MRSFWAGLAGLMMVVAVVTAYQSVTVSRIQADTIAELKNELNETKNELEEYKILAASGDTKSQSTSSSASSETEGGFRDGVYTGEAEGYGGPIDVSVTIEGGRIASIDITSSENEDASYFNTATAVVDEILEEQTTAVDTTTGATFSSAGIINAVADALEQAVE